ncbi:xylulokinase [Mycolicibacter longobardus]|uniref:Carbohydrate kinase n=1 Tax=Mycolicibacter longobardus TaxID=1108812 RepID=A0A1X1YPW7_9MYCO|nr:FGGY-family carbohydrate kinase [Mycolicibacter longobardus]MCV7382626.1 FGGY-family carbohydrate kinase [Mycolicibacter longobardus]ORW13148.1 carbohydrate kinase [Mycolicibacter longobardus]
MSRADRVVLAVDLGTGGPKVGFVSLDGTVLWSDLVEVSTDYGPGGAATQDAGLWWEIIREATRRGLTQSGVRGEQVAGVSITGQWASTIPVDADGRPAGPCVMWMDTRGAPYSRKAFGGPVAGYRPRALLSWLRRNGGIPSPSGDDPVGHMLHLQHGDPATFGAARWLLEPVDYLSMCFTGQAAASRASMMGAWLTDNRNLAVLDYDDVLVRRAGIDRAKLPPLVPTGSIIGPVAPAVAAELGISPAAQVVTGTPDLHSAAVGSGAVRHGELHLTLSTTSWISCPVAFKKTDALHQLATVPGLDPSSYLLVNNQDTAGRALQWLRDNVFDDLDYDALTEIAAGAPAGSNGVIFTPWLKGERSPIDDRDARGGFHNLSLGTTGADLVRAVLEGVAYNNRWLLDYVNKFAPNAGPIRIVGGGARSELWCQIVADVCGRTCERVADPLNAQLRGAALFAGIGMGELHRDELHDLIPLDGVFEPNAAHRGVYDRLFAEFPRLYKAQKGIFARLNR